MSTLAILAPRAASNDIVRKVISIAFGRKLPLVKNI